MLDACITTPTSLNFVARSNKSLRKHAPSDKLQDHTSCEHNKISQWFSVFNVLHIDKLFLSMVTNDFLYEEMSCLGNLFSIENLSSSSLFQNLIYLVDFLIRHLFQI